MKFFAGFIVIFVGVVMFAQTAEAGHYRRHPPRDYPYRYYGPGGDGHYRGSYYGYRRGGYGHLSDSLAFYGRRTGSEAMAMMSDRLLFSWQKAIWSPPRAPQAVPEKQSYSAPRSSYQRLPVESRRSQIRSGRFVVPQRVERTVVARSQEPNDWGEKRGYQDSFLKDPSFRAWLKATCKRDPNPHRACWAVRKGAP